MRRFWFVIVTTTISYGQWPSPKTAIEAYDFIQQRRTEAEKLWQNGDARGIDLLKNTLPYLEQPLVVDLATGNRYLAARRANIYLDLAEAYAIQAKPDESLNYLEKVAEEMPDSAIAKLLEGQKSFEAVRREPRFSKILNGFRRYDQFWDSKALSTPFQENLSEAEKLAGLGKFWAEVKYNFGYPEKLVALDWDNLYLQWIPKVITTNSTEAYYRELMRLCALVSDGHTNVYPPEKLNILSKPPLRTGLIEGHVMILEVMSPALEAQGLRPGMEIVSVDGQPALHYAKREVEPYQSASTSQDRELRTFWYGFLRGPSEKPVRLELLDLAGKKVEKEVARTGFHDIRNRPALEWRLMQPGNIGYVALNDFRTHELIKEWDQTLPKLLGTAALVLDVRLNDGGSSGIGYHVLQSLVDKPFLTSRQVMRRYNPTERARGSLMEWTEIPAGEIEPGDGARYLKPVVVLTGPATFSAAEDFLVALKNSKRGTIIGEPSGGSTGQPLFFKLPGGGSARVCTKRDTFPDGREWVGKGIDPEIVVRPLFSDVRAGRDTVLEKALEYARSNIH